MAWVKPSQETIRLFEAVLPDSSTVERKKMFGMPACFVNGNMFCGVYQQDIFFRLPQDDQKLLMGEGARLLEPMAGRPMREYVVAPPSLLADQAKLREWLGRSLAYTATLAPKAKKSEAKKKAR